jgi:hypothetical protein
VRAVRGRKVPAGAVDLLRGVEEDAVVNAYGVDVVVLDDGAVHEAAQVAHRGVVQVAGRDAGGDGVGELGGDVVDAGEFIASRDGPRWRHWSAWDRRLDPEPSVALRDALTRLRPRQRLLLSMQAAGLTYGEIAAETGDSLRRSIASSFVRGRRCALPSKRDRADTSLNYRTYVRIMGCVVFLVRRDFTDASAAWWHELRRYECAAPAIIRELLRGPSVVGDAIEIRQAVTWARAHPSWRDDDPPLLAQDKATAAGR